MAEPQILHVDEQQSFQAKYFPAPNGGYAEGLTQITDFGRDDTTIAVSFLKLTAGQSFSFQAERETAFLLHKGRVEVSLEDETVLLERPDAFEAEPSCIHLPAQAEITLTAHADTEFSVYAAENTSEFPARIYMSDDVYSVIFDDKAQPIPEPTGTPTDRLVRTVFDNSAVNEQVHTHPNATLTVGEVMSYKACWSSWRPHHHRESTDKIARGYIEESYFYHTNAFGLSQMGDGTWQEVNNHDLVLHRGNNHAQVASPDGPVCYVWVIYTPPGYKWERYLDADYTPEEDG